MSCNAVSLVGLRDDPILTELQCNEQLTDGSVKDAARPVDKTAK